MTAKNKDNPMKVYVVLEEDRGCGVSVVGVYADKEYALTVLAESCRYELREENLNNRTKGD